MFGMATAVVGLAWILATAILQGDSQTLLYLGILAAGSLAITGILLDWRNGVYLFFAWLVFEDLIRKFAGNNTAMFFAKDAIIIPLYVSMLIAIRRGQLQTFKPPFLASLALFFWLAVLQMFNPNSPSVLYGILGLKTDFFYVPLMFAGYALVRTEEGLYRFLTLNGLIALVVTGLGIAQSVLGLTFLNPADLPLELRSLGNDIRHSPITGVEIQRSTSVYVSEGRYGQALILFFILGVGTAGYFLLNRNKRGRKMAFPILGIIVLATIMSGVRGAFVGVIGSAPIMVVGMMWGVPRRKFKSLKIGKAIRRSIFFGIAAIALMTFFYPNVIRDRWTYYSETLSPQSSASELGHRSWEYPVREFTNTFTEPNWQFGNGTGMASLGMQYITRITGTRPARLFSENGYGTLVLEFGVIGPFVWLLWTTSLVSHGWKVLRQLRQTAFFPIGLAILWLAAYILIFGFFYGMAQYQSYILNAYLWLCIGILFRLPALLDSQNADAPASRSSASRASYAHTARQ